jgi:hypothetical protein
MTMASRSNILARAARRIAAIHAEISHGQHRIHEIRTNPVGK